MTGRETADGERLFYIGTVKPNGVALGHLRAGDRLLEVGIHPWGRQNSLDKRREDIRPDTAGGGRSAEKGPGRGDRGLFSRKGRGGR